MPKKQSTKARIAKIFEGKNTKLALMIGMITLLIVIINFVWGAIFFKQGTNTSTPAIEPKMLPHNWYVIFELKIPANYWKEGVHSFLFDADCPADINSISENGPTNPFSVDRTAALQTSTVFIRRRGLYLSEIKGDAFGHLIHPSQETAVIYSLFTLSLEDAKRYQDECKVFVKFDDGPFVNLPATRIDKIQ